MSHHHKTNAAVEGDPDIGHGRGLPRRPDDRELEQLSYVDRIQAGLRVKRAQRRRRPAALQAEEY